MPGPLRTAAETRLLLPGAATASLIAGGVLEVAGAHGLANAIWAASTLLLPIPLTISVTKSLLRRDVGVDTIALLAMTGALALGEYLAGAVIALMLAGGNALELYAQGRARRELTLLVDRAPRWANRIAGDAVERISVDQVQVGDRLLVRAGEVIPTDGVVQSAEAIVDDSALTGEPLPHTLHTGATARGGCTNAGEAFELDATTPASGSAYAGLVRLVGDAERRQAPFVRIADRYAAAFLPLTLVVAGSAWAVSGSPRRAVAVLVVATPCPLILAAPIAFIAGVSRAAREGVIVKGGAVIEALGRARTVLFDKTGTLTLGTARVDRILTTDGVPAGEALRIAASLDQFSSHAMAAALVREASDRGLRLSMPSGVREDAGQGIAGDVDGRRVAVGSASFVSAHATLPEARFLRNLGRARRGTGDGGGRRPRRRRDRDGGPGTRGRVRTRGRPAPVGRPPRGPCDWGRRDHGTGRRPTPPASTGSTPGNRRRTSSNSCARSPHAMT